MATLALAAVEAAMATVMVAETLGATGTAVEDAEAPSAAGFPACRHLATPLRPRTSHLL
jgi:2-methylisocitrate lyase-like PEP mutase family enzyme